MDMGSAHGTFIQHSSTTRLTPYKLYEMKVGTVIRFGASSRRFIFRAYLNHAQISTRMESFDPSNPAASLPKHAFASLNHSQTLHIPHTHEDDEVCTREICIHTALNAHISYSSAVEPSASEVNGGGDADESRPAKKRRVSENRHVSFSKAPPMEIADVWGAAPTQPTTQGKFASLVSTTTIKRGTSSTSSHSSSSHPTHKKVSDAERRRIQQRLMTQRKGLVADMPAEEEEVKPVAVPELYPAVEEQRAPPPPPPRKQPEAPQPPPTLKQSASADSGMDDTDGPMDLRKK